MITIPLIVCRLKRLWGRLWGYQRPEWYGAKGDGVSDDSQAIQRAIDAVGGRKSILTLDRTYLVQRPLKFTGRSTVTLREK